MIGTVLGWLGRGVGLIAGGYLGYVAIRGSRLLVHPRIKELIPDELGGPASPADLGLPHEDVRFMTDDGVTLAGWLIPAAHDTGAVVIVLHGFSGNRLAELAAFVPWLRRRFHVLQFDFRGHGASGVSPVTLGTSEVRDVAAAVRFVGDRGLGPVALYGLSMGGATAIISAPSLSVAAVIADAAFAELHHPVANRLRELGYPLAGLGARVIVAAAGLRARARLRSPLGAVARISPRALLLIASRGDRLISWRQSLRLWHAAGEPKELYVIDEAEHGLSWAAAGAAYERRVLDFLERHLDAASTHADGGASVREAADQRL